MDDQYCAGGVSNGTDITKEAMDEAVEYDEILRQKIDKTSSAYLKWYKTTTAEERLEMMRDAVILHKGENLT